MIVMASSMLRQVFACLLGIIFLLCMHTLCMGCFAYVHSRYCKLSFIDSSIVEITGQKGEPGEKGI